MNHKRKRPKSRRAGCLLCKPHKANELKDAEKNQTMQERRARIGDKEQRPTSVDASLLPRPSTPKANWSRKENRDA